MIPLRITSFGAKPDTDCTAAIAAALSAAKAQGQPVLIPEGTWHYNDVLVAEGVAVTGEGATLHSLNPLRAALALKGIGSAATGIRFSGVKPTSRSSADASVRILVMDASDFAVGECVVESGAGAAILVRRSSNGSVRFCQLSKTLADSVHITERSGGILVEGCDIDKSDQDPLSGDDCIAVVSYRSQGALCSGITARGNRIRGNAHGRGMSVVGGANVLYEENEIRDCVGAAGLLVAQEESYKTFGARDVTAKRNTVINCGNPAIGHFAVLVTSSGGDTNEAVILERNVVQATYGGIAVRTDFNKNITVDSNLVLATPPLQLATPGVNFTPFTGGPAGVSEAI